MASEQQQLVDSIGKYLDKNFGDRSPASMQKLFERYDVNHDGKITKDELEKLLKDVEVGNAFTRGAWVRGIVDKLDTNSDKSISWDEFRAVVQA